VTKEVNMTEQQALAEIHTRTYWPDDDTCVVVVGTRAGIETQKYVETEFVFQDGELVQAHICAAGWTLSTVPHRFKRQATTC
jgi:hypothetical protein